MSAGDYFGCSCGKPWAAIIPPPPCPVHGHMQRGQAQPYIEPKWQPFVAPPVVKPDPFPVGWDERDALV